MYYVASTQYIYYQSAYTLLKCLDLHLITERLKLKIPWKNLYSAPIIAEVDGLYAIAGPATGELNTSPVKQ